MESIVYLSCLYTFYNFHDKYYWLCKLVSISIRKTWTYLQVNIVTGSICIIFSWVNKQLYLIVKGVFIFELATVKISRKLKISTPCRFNDIPSCTALAQHQTNAGSVFCFLAITTNTDQQTYVSWLKVVFEPITLLKPIIEKKYSTDPSPSEHESLIKCWFNVGSLPVKLGHH